MILEQLFPYKEKTLFKTQKTIFPQDVYEKKGFHNQSEANRNQSKKNTENSVTIIKGIAM